MSINVIIPNLLTAANLGCGLLSIWASKEHHYFFAGYLVYFGMVFDFFDGKVARKINCTSRFGSYLDSIADFVSFGIAPAFLSYYLCPSLNRGMLAVFLFFFSFSGSFRLIRYTFFDIKVKKNELFSGLPIPAAAGNMTGAILLFMQMQISYPYLFIICLAVLNAVLMISTLPYQHFSSILNIFPRFARMILIVILSVAFFVGYAPAVLCMFFLLYLVFGIQWSLVCEPRRLSKDSLE